ncbi:MAG TPA: hypothetical protein VGV69_02895 [Solirubrobacterales bacterium]|nr:hypothetical protein [Solirubrobacterales bacterium]
MRGKWGARIAIWLAGAALCTLLFFGGFFLGRERHQDDRKEQVRAIPGLGSLPSPELVVEADQGRQVGEGSEEGQEGESEEEPTGSESGIASEEEATPTEPYEAPPDSGGSTEETQPASPLPEKPPIENTAGQ